MMYLSNTYNIRKKSVAFMIEKDYNVGRTKDSFYTFWWRKGMKENTKVIEQIKRWLEKMDMITM